jgi:uncharacterized protein (DUF58 family)
VQGRTLFDEDFLKKLEYLHIVSKKVFAGRLRAERRSRKTGSGVEFADHRQYAAGDDIRYIDWNLYGRMERLLLRLFEEEEDLSVYLLIDVSRSMGLGDPPKLDHALRVAAALAYIALANLDRVSVLPFADGIKGRLAPARGKGQVHKVFRFLEEIEPGGVTDFTTAARTFAHQSKRRGLAIVISDLYDPEGATAGLNYLRYHRFDPFVIHVYDEAELDPRIRGDLRMIDCETGRERDVTITDRLVRRYREAHAEFCREIEEFCLARQISYLRSGLHVPFDELVLQVFRVGGFLR